MSSARRKRDPSTNRELNLEDYEEMEILGQGGFGVVHKVRKKVAGEKGFYALKKIDLSKLRGKQIYEAQLLERLQHPNIVKYYGAKTEGSTLYILMEYCDGGNLDQYIKKHKPIPLGTVISIMSQLISALTYLHKENVMHRDLTVGNILFKKIGDTIIKIADFGLSRPAEKAQVLMTKAGTAPFMSPDLFNGKYDRTADYYALGATLFMMLVGKPPPDPTRISFDFKGYPQGKFFDELYKATLERTEASQDIARAAGDLVKKLMRHKRGQDEQENFSLDEVRKHDFMVSMNLEQLNKKSSYILSSSQGFNNSYHRPEAAVRVVRKRSRSNTKDSAFESGGNQLYPRTGSANGHALSMPTERRREHSVDIYRNHSRPISNQNPPIAHSDRKTKADDKWPVKEMRHLAPYTYVNKCGRFIYAKEEKRDGHVDGKIIFEAVPDRDDRVYRIVLVEYAGEKERQRVTFYDPIEKPRKATNVEPPLKIGGMLKVGGPFYRFEDIPYDKHFSGLYNLLYKSHEMVSSRVVQYELRNPFLDRLKGVTAKLYFNGDCRIIMKEKGQYLKKEGTDEFVIAEPNSLSLTREFREYFADIYDELRRYRDKLRRWNPEKIYEKAFINHDWKPRNQI